MVFFFFFFFSTSKEHNTYKVKISLCVFNTTVSANMLG